MQNWRQAFLPDRGGWYFLYLLFFMLFLSPEKLLWDGGSCRHILNGVYILKEHALPTTNYTSAVFADSPCLTRCWFGDLITGASYDAFHLNGVVLICSLAVVLGLTWSYQIARLRGVGLLSGLLGLLVVMATAGMHWSARCHVYSYLPFLVLYYVLFHRPVDRWQPIWCGIIMCWWTNLHGSFTIGAMMIAVKIFSDLCRLYLARLDKAGSLGAFKAVCIDLSSVLIAVLATCINPRGISFYSHVFGYLAHPMIMHKTDEWRSFDILVGWSAVAYLLLCGLTIWLIWAARKLPPLGETIMLFGLAIAGFYTMRMIPYCALIAMPALGSCWLALRGNVLSKYPLAETAVASSDSDAAALIDAERPLAPEGGDTSARSADATAVAKLPFLAKFVHLELKGEAQEKSGRRMIAICLVSTVLFAVSFLFLPFCQLKDFDPERIPVHAVDYMKDNNVRGLGFNLDNWGGYVYFRLHKKVFIDDWSDFLPVWFIDEYCDLLTAQNSWPALFAKYDFQWVLAPSFVPVVQVLSHSNDWEKVYEDKAGTLLIRKGVHDSRKGSTN